MLPNLPTIISGSQPGDPKVRWRVRTGTASRWRVGSEANEERSAASPEVSGSVAVSATSWVVLTFSAQPELKNPGRQTDTEGQKCRLTATVPDSTRFSPNC